MFGFLVLLISFLPWNLHKNNFDPIVPAVKPQCKINRINIPVYSKKILDKQTQVIILKSNEPILEEIIVKQFQEMMYHLFPEEISQTQDLIGQLNNKPPEKIQFFSKISRTVRLNNLNIFGKPYDAHQKEYDFYYKYKTIPNVLYQFSQCKKTERSFNVTIQEIDNKKDYIVSIKPSDELPCEKRERLGKEIQNIMQTFPKTMEFNDPIERVFNDYKEFIDSNTENDNNYYEAEYIRSSILQWLSKPIDRYNTVINVYGVSLPMVCKIQSGDKLIIYINNYQYKSIIKELFQMPPGAQIIILFVLILALCFSMTTQVQKYLILVSIIAFVLKFPIDFEYVSEKCSKYLHSVSNSFMKIAACVMPLFNKYAWIGVHASLMLDSINPLFSMFSRHFMSKEQFESKRMAEISITQFEERMNFRNMITYATQSLTGDFLLKIEYKKGNGYRIADIYEFGSSLLTTMNTSAPFYFM